MENLEDDVELGRKKPGPPAQGLGNRFTIQCYAADERLMKKVARKKKISRGRIIRDLVMKHLPELAKEVGLG